MSSKSLVIVESPAKAKTISQFLGDGFRVMASVGHVVDLPASGLCVDVDDDFKLTYEVTKKDVVRDLKSALKGAKALYLATDEDREGEAIAWHLKDQLKPTIPTQRMVFHEITRRAIQEAILHSRDIDVGLVDAQEARRTLDRLYGYEVSPVLWRKVRTGLSAGRVQSPALRLIVERERERMRFRSASYWDIQAKHPTTPDFTSTLTEWQGKRVADGRDFDDQGTRIHPETVCLDEATAGGIVKGLEGQSLAVAALERRPYRSSPKPPFITSTLQQEGGRKLSMSAQQVMRVAQSLYENGYITYMRTDSTTLSQSAIEATRSQIAAMFGAKYLPSEPRSYARKAKNAQEAHEAIRPAGESFRGPAELRDELNQMQFKLYELIWKRTLASQMPDATGETLSVKLKGATESGEVAEFSASGRTISFHGYLKAYVESADEKEGAADQEAALPPLEVGQRVPVESFTPRGHQTNPPARFTEASLVKRLEELGIGRPSTYASILGTLLAKYAWKRGQALIPNWEAFAVISLLEKHFDSLVDFAFTAELEEDLDQIASGQRKKVAFLHDFYFGVVGARGLKQQVEQNIEEIDAAAINTIEIGDDQTGQRIIVKPGKYGPYIRRGEDTVSLPETVAPDEVTVERAMQLLSAPKSDVPIGTDAASGLLVYVKQGRFGPYVQLGEASDSSKPKTQSLFRTMQPEQVTLEGALRLLSLPREVGIGSDGEVITAQNGRYGPYLTKGKETRNLGADAEERLFTVTLEEAEALFRQPKQFRGARQERAPLANLGTDPTSGKELLVKEGRFGPYVTDGETNASLRKGDDPASLTSERAIELMQLRRDYMASPEGIARAARSGKKARRSGRGVSASTAKRKKAASPAKSKRRKSS